MPRTSCSCGNVQFEAAGTPIASVACYCDDCQTGARQIEALSNAPRILESDGGTAYLLYRKDRFRCSKGAEFLKDMRLREKSPTKRVVASCCNSAMFLDFEKGHWITAYRARFGADAPLIQMRIQTRFKPEDADIPNDVPATPAFPFRLVAKVMAARLAMLLPW